jgi:hypothetical protein
MQAKCSHCHECGTRLKQVLDGEEWCPTCSSFRRYRSHGWMHALADQTPCPVWVAMRATPLHKSVVCARCGVRPQEQPGAGWHRAGLDPKTWKHLCPVCWGLR